MNVTKNFLSVFSSLTPDGRILFATRLVRLFAYGMIAIVLGLYLKQQVGEDLLGPILSLTLIGDAVISLYITINADRLGRKKMLIVGAGLMILGGGVFALTSNFILLALAAIIGTISPSGNEVGPFLAIEQAGLSQTASDERRTQILSWYTLVGSLATAVGAWVGGNLSYALQGGGMTNIDSYRVIMVIYAALGLLLGLFFLRLTPSVEAPPNTAITLQKRFGLHRSQKTVFNLSGLFMVDAFAGGLVVSSLIAIWFNNKFGIKENVLGDIFLGANILAGFSALAAAPLAKRFGLVRTMVFTHIPSNILLILVPLMPTADLAILMLWLRFSISQMDVPTRQSYTMAVVDPDERSAAGGWTNIARTIGSSIAPPVTGAVLAANPVSGLFFFLAGGLKIVYDVALYRSFITIKPPEEQATTPAKS